MRISHLRSIFVITFITASSLFSTGCHDDPVKPPDTTTTPPDTSALVLTTSTPDTIFTATGEPFHIDMLVQKGGKPADSAVIEFFDSILQKPVNSGPTGASGQYVFWDTLPSQDIQHRLYTYVIVASKGAQHDTIRRYVSVGTDPDPLVLQVTAPTTEPTYVQHGKSVTFNFLVTHKTKAEDSAYVVFFDPIDSNVPIKVGNTSGGNGMLSWTGTVANSTPSGSYQMSFSAGRRDRLPSAAVVKTIIVTGVDSVYMNLHGRSISSTSIGISWDDTFKTATTDTVIVMDGNTFVSQQTVKAKRGATATINGLSLNKVYSISVHSAVAFSETFQWATAVRFGPVRLYDNAHSDATHPCGVVLGTQGTENITHSSATPQSDIMLSFDTTSPSMLSLNSVSVTALSNRTDGKITQIGDGYLKTAAGLDNVNHQYLTYSFDNPINTYQIADGSQPNVIFTVLTADNHYAFVELESQNDGTDYGTDTGTGAKYVDLLVSYQPIANAPYAGRAHKLRGSEAPKTRGK